MSKFNISSTSEFSSSQPSTSSTTNLSEPSASKPPILQFDKCKSFVIKSLSTMLKIVAETQDDTNSEMLKRNKINKLAESSKSESVTKPAILEFDEFTILLHKKSITFSIATRAQDVFIDTKKIREISGIIIEYVAAYCKMDSTYDFIMNKPIRIIENYYPKCDKHRLDWLFVLNALNFSLWRPQNTKQWTVHGLTGYKALCFVIKRAIDEGKPIWDPNYYSKLKQSELEIIFRSDNEISIPLIHKRVTTLYEIGKVLLDKYQGTFANCVKACKGNAFKLRYLLYKEFESYRDIVYHRGQEDLYIYFGCKTSTLLWDLSSFQQISGLRYWTPTIFVDYCAPRVLLYLGIIRYSDRLKARLAEDGPLQNGGNADLQIRSCSLVAVKSLSTCILEIYKQYTSDTTLIEEFECGIPNLIDNILWCARHEMDEPTWNYNIPFHNIKSVYY